MATVFYLFAADRDELQRCLGGCKLSLEAVSRRFTRIDDLDAAVAPRSAAAVTTNNPWRLVDPSLKAHTRAAPGYGAAFSGDHDDVIDFATAFGLLDAPFFGVEVAADPSDAAGATPWQHGCPGGTFATRDAAHRLIQSAALGDAGLDGAGVNVVIVDTGVSARYVTETLGGSFGGGLFWSGRDGLRVPGQPRTYSSAPRLHGDMVARNVLALAPAATIYDLPLLPQRIQAPSLFSLIATLGYVALDLWMALQGGGRWVVVSPWAIFDRLAEAVPGNYTERRSHPLNQVVIAMTSRHDMVFPAGNSGQFCPAPRSGAYDRGPGRSILGANALEEVLCVGASRADALWIGASSQGPGPRRLSRDGASLDEKPDVSAPSWFRDPLDAALADTGTSAAAAVAGGAVAALRGGWDTSAVSPSRLKTALRDSARPFWHVGWNGRAGTGLIDLRATIAALHDHAGAPG